MRLYGKYLAMLLKTQLVYKASFAMTVVGQFLVSFTAFLGVYFLYDRFHEVEGYSFAEVLLCFAVTLTAFSLAECFARGFDVFPRLIRTGALDRILLRPRSVVFQVLTSNMDFSRLGRLAQAFFMLAYALPASGVVWTGARIAGLLLMLLGGTVTFSALFVLYAGFSFFTIEGIEFMNILTDGAREFGKYPFSVYGEGVLKLLTYVVPLALFQYYPLLYILGRSADVRLLLRRWPDRLFCALLCVFPSRTSQIQIHRLLKRAGETAVWRPPRFLCFQYADHPADGGQHVLVVLFQAVDRPLREHTEARLLTLEQTLVPVAPLRQPDERPLTVVGAVVGGVNNTAERVQPAVPKRGRNAVAEHLGHVMAVVEVPADLLHPLETRPLLLKRLVLQPQRPVGKAIPHIVPNTLVEQRLQRAFHPLKPAHKRAKPFAFSMQQHKMVDLVPHRRAFGRLLRAGRRGHQRTVAVIADEDGAAVAVIRLQKRNGGNARVDGFPAARRGNCPSLCRNDTLPIPDKSPPRCCIRFFSFHRSFRKKKRARKAPQSKIPVLLHTSQALPAVAAARRRRRYRAWRRENRPTLCSPPNRYAPPPAHCGSRDGKTR